ncbi:MAG: PAS domain S-box protein [Chloroflexi bacterium]|nr:PAS domain S-box protein [Chloroflexota bacterium]
MKFELRLSLIYCVLATLWIILSDAVLAAIPIPALVNTVQTYKGGLFVIVTSLLLYALLRWEGTIQRRSEQTVQRREESFRHLFQNNPLPMWVYNLDTLAFLDVNEAAIDQYGYSRDEFLAMRITDIRPEEDIPRLLESATRNRTPLQHSGLWRHRYKDGRMVDVEIVSHRLDYAGHDAVLVVAQNVTDRVKAQAALRQTNETLQAVFNAAPLAIFRFDEQGLIRMCNPAAERMFGWSQAELVGRFPPFVPAERSEQFLELIRGVLAGEPLAGFETQRQRKDGSRIDVSIYAAPIRDTNGTAQEVISVTADITERKQMQANLLEQERLRLALNKEIELRNLRNRFMSMVSHEFRNPLAIIASSSGLIERYYERMSADARRDHFVTIQAQIKHLAEMLDEILTLLHSESLSPEFKRAPLNLAELCNQLVADTRLQVQDTRQIEYSVSAPEITLEGDSKLLHHAIGNLLSNAVKYSPPQSRIRVELTQTDDQIMLAVQDEGIGVPEENRKLLFEPFYRGDNVGDIPGTGLGLAITQQAVDLHGGRVEVESEIGQGSTFRLYLPAAPAAI